LPRGLVRRGGRAGPPLRPPPGRGGGEPVQGRMMLLGPGFQGRGRGRGLGRAVPPRPGMMMGRGPRGPIPPRGRGPRGPMRVVWVGRGRGRGSPGGRMLVGPRGPLLFGPRGPVFGRGRGRPQPRPRIMMRPRPGRGEAFAVAPTPNAAPSWMSSVLKSDDDDNDFAQPIPVSSSTALPRDRADISTEAEISALPTSMHAQKKPYESDPQGPSEGGGNAAVGQQDTSLESGMSERGQTSTQSAPVEAKPQRSGRALDGTSSL